MSVYNYVDKILLYDTGSNDKYTLADIQKLLDGDFEKKIRYESHEIETDETKWKVGHATRTARQNKGKKGKWWVRQRMIDDTETEFFLILDGDEVYYEETIHNIVNTLIPNWPEGKLCGFMSLTWFMDLEHIFKRTKSGRVFVTDKISITQRSPNEIHTVKETGEEIGRGSDCSFVIENVTPYSHFEKMLKPWRRKVKAEDIRDFTGELPEAMQDNPFYSMRFLNECLHKQLISE
jgi:hypothetical protein